MIRKALVVVAAFGMLLFGGLSGTAEAQPDCPYFIAVGVENPETCAPAAVYPGPFTNHPAAPSGPYGWGSLNISAAPAAAAGTGGGDAGAALAHTGSESAAIAYVGAGLVAFGAVALGSRRKFFQGALD